MNEAANLKKLNVGCGLRPIPGWTNLDLVKSPGVDVQFDLETCGQKPLGRYPIAMPFEDNFFDRILLNHVFEHITNVLPMMHELYRIAKHGCEMVLVTPYGSSDNADEDPTHVRRIFKESYIYYTPLAYGGADYGVTCDWDYRRREFRLEKEYFDQFEDLDEMKVAMMVSNMRNVVKEFVGVLVAVKPARSIATATEDVKPPFTAFKFV